MYKSEIEELSKEITGIEMVWDKVKPLTEEQQLALLEQMKRFLELKDMHFNPEYNLDSNGKLVLNEGDLIHGIVQWNIDMLKKIKSTGILSSEFGAGIPEDAETFYSADFWRVEEETTMEEYSQKKIQESEGDFLPLRKRDSLNKIAIVVSPKNEYIKSLLSYDAFRDNKDSSDISKSIISQRHLNSRLVMKNRLAAILFGVPASAISGIIIGKRLVESNPDKVEEIKKIFPDKFISTQEGDIVYEPQKELLTTDDEEKAYNKEDGESSQEKKNPLEAYKEFLMEKLENTLSLLKEKEKITNVSTDLIPYKKFSFLQKHFFKRKEYKQYIQDRESKIKENEGKKETDQARLREIEKQLLKEGLPTISSIEMQIENIQRAQSFQELGIHDTNSVIEIMLEKEIAFQFESYEQAFMLAPEYLGKNVEFMKKAIRENPRFIVHDKTNNEELYINLIDIKIDELEKQLEKGYDVNVEDELLKLREYKKELESPKEVEEGKYKIPHKFMFEEIRNNEENGNKDYWYTSADGVYDEEFGKELEQLYERTDIILGIHGLNQNETIENSILRDGLKNSMQNADASLDRTVAYGKNLTFTKVLNYRIPYNGLETEAAVILTLPKDVFNKTTPVPIWGSNDKTGSENYILSKYIYGLYHGKSDGEKRRIIRNNVDPKEQTQYKYLKYDYKSSHSGQVVEGYQK